MYRFRQAGTLMRAQIKWLAFASLILLAGISYRLVVYVPGVQDWTDYLLLACLVLFAIATSFAILRARFPSAATSGRSAASPTLTVIAARRASTRAVFYALRANKAVTGRPCDCFVLRDFMR